MIDPSTAPFHFSHSFYSSLFTPIEFEFKEDCLGNAYAASFATCILDTKYEQANIHDITFNQQHLLNQ